MLTFETILSNNNRGVSSTLKQLIFSSNFSSFMYKSISVFDHFGKYVDILSKHKGIIVICKRKTGWITFAIL